MLERVTSESTCIAALKARLLRVPGVIDAHIVAREIEGGIRLAAYVSGGQRDVLEAAAAGMAHVALVRVQALPLHSDGSVDEERLTALPAWSGAAMPPACSGQEPSAMIYRPTVPVRRRLHLADMLPDYPLLAPTAPEAVFARTPEAPVAIRQAIYRAAPLSTIPGMPTSLASALQQAAQDPTLGAIHVAADMSETRVSYAELLEQARRILGGLRRHGVHAGDVVLVDAGDSRCLLPLFWACVLGAMVPAPFMVATAAAGGAPLKRLRDSWEVLGRPFIAADAATLRALAPLGEQALSGMRFLDAAALGLADCAAPTPTADVRALAMVFMTSGSTGLPKGVMLSQANIMAMIGGVLQRGAGLTPGATAMNWMPLDHVGGLGHLSVLPIMLGMNQVQVETATVLAAPARWLDLVHRHRVGLVWTPNFAFDLLLQAASRPGKPSEWDLSSLRMLINGGEAVSDSVLTAFATRFAESGLPADAICPSFGMTETASAFTLSRWAPGNGATVSLGAPICGAAHRIVDEQGEPVSEGVTGSVELAGDSVFMGYFGRDDLTSEVMHGEWFRSGDMGFMRDGELFVVGRGKEMIIVNGANFYNGEIEEQVAQTPGVERLSVAAVGVRAPGARTDQLAVFFHAPDAHGDDALLKIMQDIRTRLGGQMSLTPAYFAAVRPERLPRTSSGKVRRIELKRMMEAGDFDTEIKRAACLLAAPQTIPAWFSTPFWKPCAHRAPLARNKRGIRVAVLGDGSPDEQAMRVALAQAAGDLDWRQLDVGREAGRMQLDASDLLLVLPSRACLPELLSLCRTLATTPAAERPSRLVVCGSADNAVEYAAAAGFLRSAALELHGMRCLYLQFSGKDLRSDAAMILDDLRRDAGETDVIWRQGQRHVMRWREVLPQKAAGPAWRTQGICLLCGGLGGIGLLMARHWLEHHPGRLLITGRTARQALDPARAQALHELEESGRVMYASADVADVDAMHAAVAQACARWDGSLDGIVHLAGEGRQRALAEESAASLAQTMHAKSRGSQALGALLDAYPQAWCVMVGSVVGMVAGHGDSAYAAANAWQAAWVQERLAAGRGRCRYVGFSAWRGTGLSKGGAPASALAAAGYFSLEPKDALAGFDVALGAADPILAIGLDMAHARHAALRDEAIAADEAVLFRQGQGLPEQVRLQDHFGRERRVPVIGLAALPLDGDGAVDHGRLARLASGLAQADGPRSGFERFTLQLWCRILEIPSCGVRDDFFALGGNSLRAAQITARIHERLRLPVGMPDLLLHPTVAGFCAHVQQAESKPGITEAIALRWLEIEQMPPEQKAARLAARQ